MKTRRLSDGAMEARTLATLAVLLALAGCVAPNDAPNDAGTAPSTTAPPSANAADCKPVEPKPDTVSGLRQDSVSNNAGSFSDSGQVAGATGTAEYAWTDASGRGQISWGGQAGSGSLKLTLLDACGKQVYTHTWSAPSQGGVQENAQPGTPGKWLVRMEFTAFTGQMGLSIVG